MIDSQYFKAIEQEIEFPYPQKCDKYDSCLNCKEPDCNYEINLNYKPFKKELHENLKRN
jgi:hypothetical protein